MLATRIRPEVEAAIRDEVERVFPGLTSFKIRADYDHTGDDSIYVDIRHPLSASPFDTALTLELTYEVNNRSFALDERRFVYVNEDFADGQKIKGR
jgi:hypothetical protein